MYQKAARGIAQTISQTLAQDAYGATGRTRVHEGNEKGMFKLALLPCPRVPNINTTLVQHKNVFLVDVCQK